MGKVREVDSYEELTVEELKDELSNRQLPVSGAKAELVERLEEDDMVEEKADKGPGRGTGPAAEKGFEANQSAQIASATQEVAELKAETKQNTADVKDLLARVQALESA